MSTDERREFARQIHPARIAAGMSRAALAEATGVHANTIANVEAGQRVPQPQVLWSLMDVLGILPDEPVQWTPDVERWLRIMAPLVSALPEGRRQALMLETIERLADELGRSVATPE